MGTPRPVRRAFRLGYVFGLAFFVISIHWIALLSDVAITIPWLKYPAWLCAAAYLALFPALACALAAWLTRRSALSLAATFPPAAVVIEELRASGELGFPWFQPGYSQHAYAPLIQMASLGGVTLVTAWILLANVLLWRGLLSSPAGRGRSRLALAGAALAILLPWLWGWRTLAAAPRSAERPSVALVQGDIPGEVKWEGTHERQILDQFLRLSDEAVAGDRRPILVIWPEMATGSYLRKNLDQVLQVARFAERTQVPVFAGFPDYGYDSLGALHYFNSAGVFEPDGSLGPTYAKRHLVPFGERMPFQRWFPWLGSVKLGQAEWTPGAASTKFASVAGPFSCLICFEAIFPDLSREDVRGGARWLVNITNDEWFGNSVAITQHAGMSVFRAVENHVPLARCANTGLTLIADSYGRVTHRIPILAPRTLVGTLGAPGPTTPYTRFGDWPGIAAALLTIGTALRRWIPLEPRPR